MRRVLLILGGMGTLVAIALCFAFWPATQRIYALTSGTAEFTFMVLDNETKSPISGAVIDICDDPFEFANRKKIAQIVTDNEGVAKYLRKNQSMEKVVGLSASEKLKGVRRHPPGVGTFVDRFWCTLDITADGYVPLQYDSLGNYEYDDNGHDKVAKLHRFEFTLTLRRK